MSRTILVASLVLTLCSIGASRVAAVDFLPPMPDAEESAAELPPPEGTPTPVVEAPVLNFEAASLQISAGTITLSFDELADTSTLQLLCDRAVQAGNLWYAADQDLSFAASEGLDHFELEINGSGGLTLTPGVYRLSAQVESATGVKSAWVTIQLEIDAESSGAALAHADLGQGETQTLLVSGAEVGNAQSASFGSDIQVGNLTRQDDDNLVVTLTVGALAATGTRDFVLQLANQTATGSVRVRLPAAAAAEAGSAPHRNAAQSHDGVLLADGAYRWQQCDLRTRGRMLDLAADRTYRGSGDFNGPLGRNWFGRYFERATKVGGIVTWLTPDGWLHEFTDAGDGLFLAPAGVYAVIRHDAATGKLTLHERDGTCHNFAADGRLLSVQDRHGNATRLQYDNQGRLTVVHGDRGTQWLFGWHSHGRVASITDSSWSPARVTQFQYDAEGNLAGVLWPQTAAFNETRENQIQWQFGYDEPGRLNRVVWPREQATDFAGLTLDYDSQNRVVQLNRGALVTRLVYGTDEVEEFDPRGVRTRIDLDESGHTAASTRFNGLWEPGQTSPTMTTQPLRDGESAQSWTTTTVFGPNHEMTLRALPSGRQEQWEYPEPAQQTSGSQATAQGRELNVQGAQWQAGQWRNYFLRIGSTAASFQYHLIRNNNADTLELWTAPAPGESLVYAVFKDNPDPLAAGNVLARRWLGTGSELECEAFNYEATFQLRKAWCTRTGAWWLYRFDHEGDNATGTGNQVQELSPVVTVPDPAASPFTVRVKTAWRFNYQGQPTAQIDAEGVETTFSYATEGASAGLPLRTVVDAGGLALTSQTTWDAAGNLASRWSPRAFEPGATADDFRTYFVFNELGWQVQQTSPRLHVGGSDRADTRFLHDANGNLTHVMRKYVTDDGDEPDAPSDAADAATYPRSANAMAATWIEETREYDLLNRQTALIEDAIAGEVIHRLRREFAFDASGNPSRQTSPMGRVTATLFDERDLTLTESRALGSPDQGDCNFTYDADGRLVDSIDERGKGTTRSYDPQGRLLRITQPEGDYRQYTWTAAGLAASETALDAADSTLSRQEWSYDEIDRLTASRALAKTSAGADIGSGWNCQIFTRDRTGRVVTWGHGTAIDCYVHDNAGRLVGQVDASGNSLSATLDADGNLLSVTGTERFSADNTSETGTWSADYDPCGRRIAQRDRRHHEDFSTELTMTYDGLSRLTQCARGDRVCHQNYDLRGRTTDFSDDASESFCTSIPRQSHDDDDMPYQESLVPASPAAPVTVTRQYDDRGRLRSLTCQNQNPQTRSYDAAGNETQRELEDGTVVTQQFDDNGRLTSREVTFADQALGLSQETFSWDGLGRLVAGTRQTLGVTTESTFAYNTTGVRTQAGQSVYVGTQLLDSRAVADTCDEAGNVTGVGFSDNSGVTLDRDALARMRGVDAGNGIATTLQWVGPNRQAAVELPGNVTCNRQFEPGAVPQIQQSRLSRGDLPLRDSWFTRNEQAELTGLVSAHQSAIVQNMTRGGHGQLTRAEESGANAPAHERSFIYDVWRNLSSISESQDQNVILTREYTSDASNLGRWTSADGVTLGWDERGCLQQAQGAFLAWTHDQRPMLAATDSGWQQPTLRIAYDVLGRPVLVQRPTTGSISVLVYGPDGNLREEHRGTLNGFTQSRYLVDVGAGCILQRQGGAWSSQIRDAHGSLEAIVNSDGQRKLELDYLEDGTPLSRRILLDLDPADLTLSKPTVGIVKIQTAYNLPAGITWPGLELELWWQDGNGSFRSATTISAAGADWLWVADPDGTLFAALENGCSALVLDCRYEAGDWTVDRETGLSTLTVPTSVLDESFVGGFITPDVDNPCWLEILQVDVQAGTLVARGDVSVVSQGRWRVAKGAIASGLEGEYLWRGMRLLGTPQGSQGHARMLWYLGQSQVDVPLLQGRITHDQYRPWSGRGLTSAANLMADASSGPALPTLPGTVPARQ